MAALARGLSPETEIRFVTTENIHSVMGNLFPGRGGLGPEDLELIAQDLAQADVVGLSCMTASAEVVQGLAQAIKRINPKTYLLWGGVHPTANPDQALPHVDAICVGEGQVPYRRFFDAFSQGRDYTQVSNLWLRHHGREIRNPLRALNTPEELGSFPYMFFHESPSQLYDPKQKGFRPVVEFDYIKHCGLAFNQVWTLGCPFACVYCQNHLLTAMHPDYRQIRYPPVDYVIGEIEKALGVFPFLSTVAFHDDNFIGLPMAMLEEFSEKYQERIGLPFVVFGMHPNLVRPEKVEILAQAGMNRTRMGIQSGSREILEFYERKTPLANIQSSANTLARAARRHRMIPPAYDIICDNPLETREILVEGLEFLHDLERPFTLIPHSLRIFPRTKLWDYFQGRPDLDLDLLTEPSYLEQRMSMANIALFLLAVGRPPKFLWKRVLARVEDYSPGQREYPVLGILAKIMFLAKRALDHLRKMDFSTIGGAPALLAWRLGLTPKSRKSGGRRGLSGE